MSNKVGIYYAYWTHDWDADFMPYLRKAKQLGFDVLEVNAGTIADMGPGQAPDEGRVPGGRIPDELLHRPSAFLGSRLLGIRACPREGSGHPAVSPMP